MSQEELINNMAQMIEQMDSNCKKIRDVLKRSEETCMKTNQ